MSQSKIYVGNLSYDCSNEDLSEYFGQYGEIAEVKLITDRETGRSKGFAFITYADGDQAKAALDANGSDFMGRPLRVNEAREENRGGGRGGRGGRDGGGRGRGDRRF